MSTSPLTKIAIVGLPVGLLLTFGGGGVARTLAIAVGAALIGFAWIRFERRAAATPPPPTSAGARERRWRTEEERRSPLERRIDRRPTGRGARDVRCPAAARATARARRSR